MDLLEIELLEERLRLAMLKSQVEELDVLLADSLVFTTFLGNVISKGDDLAAHRSGELKMHSIELSDVRMTPLEGVVVVTCCATIDATFDGDRTLHDFRFTRVWARGKSGAFQLMAGQATLVFADG